MAIQSLNINYDLKFLRTAQGGSAFTEQYSLDGQVPAMRFGIMGAIHSLNTVNSYAGNLSVGWTVWSSATQNVGDAGMATRLDANNNASVFPRYIGQDLGGPGWMSNVNDAHWYVLPTSVEANRVHADIAGTTTDAFSYYYAGLALAGSVQFDSPTNHAFSNTSASSTVTRSFNGLGQADLVFNVIAVGCDDGIVGVGQAGRAFSYTFHDRNLNFVGMTGGTYDDASGKHSYGGIHTDGIVTIIKDSRTNTENLDWFIDVTSVAGGYRYDITSTGPSAHNDTAGFYQVAMTFGNTNAITKLGTFGLTDPASGARTIQINSFLPDFGWVMHTSARTVDWLSPGVDTMQLWAGMGIFTADGDAHEVSLAQVGSAANNAARNTVSSGYLFWAEHAQYGFRYRGSSVQVGTTGISYWLDVSTTEDAGVKFGYAMVGQAIDAPTHLMDANSASIFLADDSDYSDNLLLVAAAPAGPTSSTLKAGQWSGLWDGFNNAWTESFSNAGVPFFSLRIPPTTGGFAAFDPGLVYGISFSVTSSDNSPPKTAVGLYAADEANTIPLNRVFTSNSGDNHLQDPVNFSLYDADISSVGENQINFVEVDALGNTYAYMAATISGSMQAEAYLGSTLVLSTGQSQLYSLSFQPDLIFVFMPQPDSLASVNSEASAEGRGFSYGFYDVRSSLGRFVGLTQINSLLGTPTDPYNTIVSTEISWPGGSVDLNAKFSIASVSANGFYINATLVNTHYGTVTEARPIYSAIKFLDPTMDFKIVDVTLPDSPGTQTFSLGFAPKFAYALGTNVKTLDYYYSPTTTVRNEALFQGLWAESDGASNMSYYMEQSLSSQDIDWIPSSTDFGHMYLTASRSRKVEIQSLTGTGSTNLQWTVNYSGTDAVNAFFPMLVIGVNENIGAGSSDPGSTPPSSSGPAAAGALFRSQPVTDNRKFPTPLTNVRAFPSD